MIERGTEDAVPIPHLNEQERFCAEFSALVSVMKMVYCMKGQ